VNCRFCGAELVLPFLDLGSSPASNAYLTAEALSAPETWFPLRLLACTECWLVQTEDHAGREALFTDNYAYFSSVSTSWLEHARRYVERVVDRFSLGSGACVAEIAANDGYLLQFVRDRGIPCYGVEPTRSTAAAARQKGIEIVEEFFGVELAERLVRDGRAADLTVANNVLAHVPDINDFVAAFAELLKPSGVATFEFPHILRMVREAQFDTAYHEHYSYLSLTAVQRIFARNDLDIFDVEELGTHGGSLRVFAQRRATRPHPAEASVGRMLEMEAAAGVETPRFYERFQTVAEEVKNGLLQFLLTAHRDGKTVCGYGAAAKGNTLLNFAGVKPDLLREVYDAAPSKQGKFMPGSRIPILHPKQLRTTRPDYVLILPWNISSEVMTQLSFIGDWGARFVTAVPRLTIW
jgi:SAM-dependent methyltransferase